ncbi:MAG: ABC transporter ATP-binding protein [Synergistaceae bacterium]|nr:ABC transporter ATP-binding protein [Synergistaceae bacterium]MBQ9903914.1 ABC transporter ATP-binding protein [Synergistaceae bacterium]
MSIVEDGIRIADLSFRYSDDSIMILKDINAQVKAGEFVCILGQSGCGKSTLLRLIAGLEKPVTGEILLNSKPIKGASLDRGVVFQDYGLFPWMTAGENIRLALEQKFKDWPKNQYKEKTLQALQQVGLNSSIYKKLPKALSGGMKQRCAIAQAFAIEPSILLMDEPFGALDAVTRARLQDMLMDLWTKQNPKKTIIFVTHDVDEAILLANRIIVLGQSPGRIIYECSVPETTREKQFEDIEILRLRNELIRQINKDVASHALS